MTAIGPTNPNALVPLQNGAISNTGNTGSNRVSTETNDRRGIQDRNNASQSSRPEPEVLRAEPIDEDAFQSIIEQATDRIRQGTPNLPRGSVIDILA